MAQLGSPALAFAIALVSATVLARVAPPSQVAAIAIALRSFLPDLVVPLDSSGVRDRLSWPLLTTIPQPEALIAVGSLLGGKADLPSDLRDAFARTGTTHLLAASGFNITLVAGALGAALRPAGGRAVAAGTIAAAFAMAFSAGLPPGHLPAPPMSLAPRVPGILRPPVRRGRAPG